MEDEENTRTLFIGNVDASATEDILYELFLQAGPLEYVKIPKGKNFAFICFRHQCSVPYAVHLLNGTNLHGRNIKVQCKNRSREIDHIPVEKVGVHSLDPDFNRSFDNGLLGTPSSLNYMPPIIPYPQVPQYSPFNNAPGLLPMPNVYLGQMNQGYHGGNFQNRLSFPQPYNVQPISIDTRTMNNLKNDYEGVSHSIRNSNGNHSSPNLADSGYHGKSHDMQGYGTERFSFNKRDNAIFRKEPPTYSEPSSRMERNPSHHERSYRDRGNSDRDRGNSDRYKHTSQHNYTENSNRNHRDRSDYNQYSHRDRGEAGSYSHREKRDYNRYSNNQNRTDNSTNYKSNSNRDRY